MRLDWKIDDGTDKGGEGQVAIIKAVPWLAYGCGEGARIAVRAPGAVEGRCATVQRPMRDDAVVLRFDGAMGESSVDPSPLTVVRTTNPRHVPGTRLLFMHEKACVDAVVEKDPDMNLDVKEGTRHRLTVVSAKVTGWVSLRTREGLVNLREVGNDGEGHTTYVVISYKPLVCRLGAPTESDKSGMISPKQIVAVFETKDLKDGTVRAHVATMKGAPVVVSAALNEFNHSVQRFPSVSEYEVARQAYCHDMVQREEYVEDAITGNLLRIKDQTLHVSTAADVADNSNIPNEWKVDSVVDLVQVLLRPSPYRAMGAHPAQPVLMRAGPGTGKTWMIKQAAFGLADSLKSATTSTGGIRLVPIVVFVQRIVFLLRDGGAGQLLSLYIEAVYAGKKMESWRKMLSQAFEMRALVVLIDGVDEAAGLRDEIEEFIHGELVPSGNRVLVTSRPEGVTLSLYRARFVIMNLNQLTNAQQRAAVSVQMQGSLFFEHLLSLSAVRRQLDDVYDKLKDSVQNDLNDLWAPNRFCLAGSATNFDPIHRQTIVVAEEVALTDEQLAIQALLAAAKAAKASEKPADDDDAEATAPAAISAADAVAMAAAVEPEVRYHTRLVAERSAPKSSYLKGLDKTMRRSAAGKMQGKNLLECVDHLVSTVPLAEPASAFQTAIGEFMGVPLKRFDLENHAASQLGLMLRKDAEAKDQEKANLRGKKAHRVVAEPAASVWTTIMSRTDELYTVAEGMLNKFEKIARILCRSDSGDKGHTLEVGRLKNPVRLVAKARELYSNRFEDGVLPESCVTDVVRGRVRCATGSGAVDFIQRLTWGEIKLNLKYGTVISIGEPEAGAPTPASAENAEVSADATTATSATPASPARNGSPAVVSVEVTHDEQDVATVELMDLSNKFRDLDPTHFRYATTTLRLTYRQEILYCELEVHLDKIAAIGLDPSNQAYEHYNFFRTRLAGTVPEDQLNALLEQKLVFLVDATSVPVLLSLLVLIFTAGGEDLTKLPSNRIELYELGIESAIHKRLQTKKAAEENAEDQALASDVIIRRWMTLFNLDRTQMTADDESHLTEKKREHRPSRKTMIKFDEMGDVGNNAKGGTAAGGEQDRGIAIKDPKDLYEIFRHGSHYLREAAKPEVQRTELNRIELSMPKKLVDTVMMLVNTNLKVLLGGRAHDIGIKMLRNVAVINQQNGRREFSSAQVSSALLLELPIPEGFTMWLHLDKEEMGLPLTKTLEAQTDASPAKYQFKHLSFQEGLFAQHLLMQAEEGWEGWANDEAAAEFLNNPFMNNTCRIGSGFLGTLLAKHRATWDFSGKSAQLNSVGLFALWLLMENNVTLERLILKNNGVGKQHEDSAGLAKMFTTSTTLTSLDLAQNHLGALKQTTVGLRQLARGLSQCKNLTEIDLSDNGLWPEGIRPICVALRTCSGMQRVNLSYNHPGRDLAIADLLRVHTSLQRLSVIEAPPQTRIERSFFLDARGKEQIGRALLESNATLRYLVCDNFALDEGTTTLLWRSDIQNDAVLLAGALKTNDTLTAINLSGGKTAEGVDAALGDFEREELGRSLLRNLNGRVGYCDIYGLKSNGNKSQAFDLKDKTQIRSLRSFVFFAGLLRGNATLTALELASLGSDHIELLSEALRSNTTLQELKLVHNPKANEKTIAKLPVQSLNGNKPVAHINLWEVSSSILDDGAPHRSFMQRQVTMMVGALLATNQSISSLRINPGPGAEGGGVLEHLHVAHKSSLRLLDISAIGLGDRGGPRLCELLGNGMCSMCTSIKLGNNKLTDAAIGLQLVEVLRSEQCTLTSVDMSGNEISGVILARIVRTNTTLTSVDFRKNPIDDNALWLIGGLLLEEDCACRLGALCTYAFEVEETATKLSLRDQSLAVGAARCVIGVIKFNRSVTTLDLSGCGITVAAANSLARALVHNTTLVALNLSNNPVSDVTNYKDSELEFSKSSFHQFAAAASNSISLASLTLVGTPLPLPHIKGAGDLSSRSKVLDLSNQSLNPLSGILIGALVLQHTSLTEISLNNNVSLGPEGARAIVDKLNVATMRTLDLNGVIPVLAASSEPTKVKKQLDKLGTLCASVGKLTHLERLTIDKDSLVDFSQIGILTELKTLTVNNNRIETLPDNLSYLRSLRRIAARSNRLLELPVSIGQLESLESLDLKGNRLTYLPSSIGQLTSLKQLDVSENSISQLEINICSCVKLDKLELKQNPLTRPPFSIAKQGLQAIRRYFQELSKSGEATSQGSRLVFLGHGEAGKTSLQRGLRYGAPRPADKDERTVQLDISSLLVGDGANQVLISMWDLGGQVHYASLLQPYIVTGSLYLLLVPVDTVASLDERRSELLLRWLDYLQVGAPEAVVQPVLTHCDRYLRRDVEWTSFAMQEACSKQVTWLSTTIEQHQQHYAQRGEKMLKIQQGVVCVSAVVGGDASLKALRSRLESIVLTKPPLLPSIGLSIPRTWLLAIGFLRAIREGREPVRAVQAAVASQESKDDTSDGLGDVRMPARPYISLDEAHRIWEEQVIPSIEVAADAAVLDDAVSLLVNQGEIFMSASMIFLQPDFVTRLLRPFVDHRLGDQAKAPPRKGDTPAPAEEPPSNAPPAASGATAAAADGVVALADKVKVPLTKVERHELALRAMQQLGLQVLVKEGELREELLHMMWQPLGLDVDEYGDLLLLMAASGVLFLSENSFQGRRWTMPLRLPDAKPQDLLNKKWAAIEPTAPGAGAAEKVMDQLGIECTLGRIAPPGVIERIMASCYGFGQYLRCWKRGALIELNQPAGALVLMELRWRVERAPEGNEEKTPAPAPTTAAPAASAQPAVEGDVAAPAPGEVPGEAQGGAPASSGETTNAESDAASPTAPATAAAEPAAAPGSASAPAAPAASESSKDASKSSVRTAYVALEIRGRKMDRSICWATLLRLHELAQRVIADFPGLSVVEEAICPGCVASPKHQKKPMRWPMQHMTSRSLKCEACGEVLELNMVLKERAPPPTQLSLSLVPPAHDASEADDQSRSRRGSFVGGEATSTAPGMLSSPAGMLATNVPVPSSMRRSKEGATVHHPPSAPPPTERRFVASQVRLGKGIEATYRLHYMLGLRTQDELYKLRAGEEQTMEDEIFGAADPREDEYGWTAADWLRYLKDELTQQPSKPRGGGEDGATADVPDSAHPEGKPLDEFVNHPLALAAKLSRAHVLALRLWSTPVFAQINEALHFGCSVQRPHPYPATVANLCEAWKRLRQATEEKPQLFMAFGALGAAEGNEKPFVWRVWNSAEELGEYKQRGGLELGFTSGFKTRAAAEKHAARLPKDEVCTRAPSLLKIRVDLEGLVDVSFVAVRPEHGECLFPPGCYFEFRSETVVASMVEGLEKGRRQEVKFSVIDAAPQLAALPNK